MLFSLVSAYPARAFPRRPRERGHLRLFFRLRARLDWKTVNRTLTLDALLGGDAVRFTAYVIALKENKQISKTGKS